MFLSVCKKMNPLTAELKKNMDCYKDAIWQNIIKTENSNIHSKMYYDFQFSKAQEKFCHKVLKFKLPCC